MTQEASERSDRAYFQQRLKEERTAALIATAPKAGRAHEALASLYAGQAQVSHEAKRSYALGRHNLARQDALLDRALADTFPASDPASASHVD